MDDLELQYRRGPRKCSALAGSETTGGGLSRLIRHHCFSISDRRALFDIRPDQKARSLPELQILLLVDGRHLWLKTTYLEQRLGPSPIGDLNEI